MASQHQKGRTPRPNLANLEAYLEAGIDHDHEKEEVLAIADYHGLYQQKLTRQHLARPMRADDRLWTNEDILRAEGNSIDYGTQVNLRRTGSGG
jgi:hypothetical protein